MKRFFIFAAMLLTMTSYAGALDDYPPIFIPGEPEKVILVPQDLYDIDRSIVLCEYICQYDSGIVHIYCYGTGRRTELSIVDSYGNVYEHTTIDTDICNYTILSLPQDTGDLMLILNSERYYGESIIRIE